MLILILYSDLFPPPYNIILDYVGKAELTFRWSNVEHDGCSLFHYAVNGDNCGTCSPLSTTINSSTCNNFQDILLSENNICNFTVSSVICDDIAGEKNFAVITLKGIIIIIIIIINFITIKYILASRLCVIIIIILIILITVIVPDPPTVRVIPHYSFETSTLKILTTNFTKSVRLINTI